MLSHRLPVSHWPILTGGARFRAAGKGSFGPHAGDRDAPHCADDALLARHSVM
jgi:hypothetical protein